MRSERWRRLTAIFDEALTRPREKRAAFLDEACKDDESLKREVASLLVHHEEASALLEPSVATAAVASADAGLQVGDTLGPYVVLRRAGHGGMGVVYQAEDTRLGRPVALKALPPRMGLDEARRERLRREARAAAALSHPGIATVYALEEFDGHLYIVSEYVPGETLRAEVARGPVPVPKLLETATDIARALAAAHERGIIHRDLKPENVMRMPDGRIKILDFGLARFLDLSTDAGPGQPRLTEPGAIVGTPGYMSPEQLRGVDVDFRSDLFTFGVVLYELASGVHPFAASDAASAIVRVIEAEPPGLERVSPDVPHGLRRIVGRCLEKSRDARYPATRDLVRELESVHLTVAGGESGAEEGSVLSATRTPDNALWWWKFHQAVVGLGYYFMLVPMWQVRERLPDVGLVLFFAALAAVAGAANLRLHLWFTSHFYPAQLTAQRNRAARWIRRADVLFSVSLLAAGVLIGRAQTALATLLVSVAVGFVVGFAFIEPATARAAFRRSRNRQTPRPKSSRR